jgi:hypothetical protein
MSEQIQMLKAEIAADLQTIETLYAALDRLGSPLTREEQFIALAYFLHNLYCAFENIFHHITQVFGDPVVSDRSRWPAEVLQLQQMTLAIEGLRPRVISDTAYDCLNEMRRFRHRFRYSYRTRLERENLQTVSTHASELRTLYQTEIDRFITFLDSLLY